MTFWIKEFIEDNIELVDNGEFRKLFKMCPEDLWYQLVEVFSSANIDYSSDFIKFANNYLEDEALQKFVSLSVLDWTYPELSKYVKQFIRDKNKFSRMSYTNETTDQGLFYTKYLTFAEKCKELRKTTTSSQVEELCHRVDYEFPFGWKIFKDYYKNYNNILDIGAALDKT